MTSVTQPSPQYLELIHRFPLRPLRSEHDYEAASKLVTELAVRGEERLSSGEQEYLDALALLMEAYQSERGLRLRGASPRATLKRLMHEHNLRAVDVARRLEVSEAAVSMILGGKRPITADHARTLGLIFKLPPGTFI